MNKILVCKLIFVLFFFVAPGNYLWSKPVVQHSKANSALYTPEDILGFAGNLFESREYFRAASEYERFLYHYGGNKTGQQKNQIAQKILACYYYGRGYSHGQTRINALLANQIFSRPVALYWQGVFAYKTKELSQALAYWQQIKKPMISSKADSLSSQNSLYLLKNYFMFWSYWELGQYKQAKETLQSLDLDAEMRGLVMPQGQWIQYNLWQKQINQALQSWNQYKSWLSPAGAAVFSAFIPGSGQLLQGRYWDGWVSFFAVGVLGSLTYLAYQNNERNLAIFLAGISLTVYTGNIYGAYYAGQREQKRRQKKYLQNLQQKYFYEPDFSQVHGF